MSIPVEWRVRGADEMERKLNNIDKGLKNIAAKQAALKAVYTKLRAEAKSTRRRKRPRA